MDGTFEQVPLSCPDRRSMASVPRRTGLAPGSEDTSMTDYATLRRAMVDCQVRPSDVTTYGIIDAMLSVPREDFVPQERRDVAYADAQIPLSANRVILDPMVFAKMLDAASPDLDDLVLLVGAGFGYGAAVLARLSAAVIAVEDDAERAEECARILAEGDALNAVVEVGDLAAGAPDHGPYDIIFVEGGMEAFPETLASQVKPGGRIVGIFADGAVGQCMLGHMSDTGITWRRAFDATAPILPGFEAEKSFEF